MFRGLLTCPAFRVSKIFHEAEIRFLTSDFLKWNDIMWQPGNGPFWWQWNRKLTIESHELYPMNDGVYGPIYPMKFLLSRFESP